MNKLKKWFEILQAGDLSELSLSQVFTLISDTYLADETTCIIFLQDYLALTEKDITDVAEKSGNLIKAIRQKPDVEDSLDALLREYNLSTKEGLVLMCLAEALLRIPDAKTADALIRDKIAGLDWKSHKGRSNKSLVNLATIGLMVTGKIISADEESTILRRLTQRLSEPVIRAAVYKAMEIMGRQFVLGRTIDEAIANGRKTREKGYTYTFDMLGEAALTQEDASFYFKAYENAILVAGKEKKLANSAKPSLSIKLSALHPRYEVAQKERVMTELFESVKKLLMTAQEHDIEISIDAEEADRLELSLHLFEKLLRDEAITNWGGLGLVVQGYSKWALPVLLWTTLLGKTLKTVIPIRLVKGAYWDTEIKASQVRSLDCYPVYTRKENTDISYLACAKFLLSDATKDIIRPQFATHNAHTVTSILALAGERDFEFQRLHGMGEALYDEVIKETQKSVRIYAPVGDHSDLLPYLVRRLLENGANSSFVHQLVDPDIPIDTLTEHPIHKLEKHDSIPSDIIQLPPHILADQRKNSKGLNINSEAEWAIFEPEFSAALQKRWSAISLINGEAQKGGDQHDVYSPFDLQNKVGDVTFATQEQVTHALDVLERGWFAWNKTPVEQRAQILEKTADLLEEYRAELIALCSLEAGKTVQDGIDEVKEAVDFCRYYAIEARRLNGEIEFQGPTGERNTFFMEGKGIFVCISPWNFPLAIYLGQISAALVTGNVVLAKPAETTSLIAYRVAEILFEAGLPKNVLALMLGSGSELGEVFTSDLRVDGVCFTGSTLTAQRIQKNLANRDGAIATLIAETGGQNVMFADSTSLPEQVVKDALLSAFGSAGQRCSALRVLYLQEDIADRIINMLSGALQDLVVGIPYELKTDLGPVISKEAQENLLAHCRQLKEQGNLIAEGVVPSDLEGYFVPPSIFKINSISELTKEHFGPIMHVIRYKREQLLDVIQEINGTCYGLTMGIHSRNEETVDFIKYYARVGNIYVNRNQVGAVVGVQPFGGRGLSGTGPKAGGPHYLLRFMTECSVSNNTAAIGGNAALLSLNQKN